MLRDLKFFRRNSGKDASADSNDENVAPVDGSVVLPEATINRAPFSAIQEAKYSSDSERDAANKRKIEKALSKVGQAGPAFKRNHVDDQETAHLRTPDKPPIPATPGGNARNRFGWAMKNDNNGPCANNAAEDFGAVVTNNGFTTPRLCKTLGRTQSFNSEGGSTQSVPNKSVGKQFNRATGSALCSKQNLAFHGSIPTASTAEVPYFELKEDPSFWTDHNVQVVIRIRPINSMERELYGYNRCLKQDNAQSISWSGQSDNRFTFDHVACETINQEAFFRVVGLPMVENCISGYNSCIFAYGQTGSGKTHTMLGEINELDLNPSSERGMTPRVFEFLFARIKAEEESRRDENLRYSCKCSFLEIYNEQITDLLDPSSTNLLLREDTSKGVYVENLTEFPVETVTDILKLLIQGSANRKVAATNMNRESSRSHSVFTCIIQSRWEKNSTTNMRFARLNLVDLAGSERQKTSGAEGERLKEAASINKSLSTLGHVMMVLVDVARGKQRHIPYRDSRLTFLLQDSLGGNSKTMVIANISPSVSCASETLSTLKFAQRAKLIQNNAIVNEDAVEDVAALHHQIKLLKEELAMLKDQNISRSLSFRSAIFRESVGEQRVDPSIRESKSLRLSTKQIKSVETLLAGALRREKIADTSMKQLQAEIEQLNRLVRQREEDTQCTKMMLKFREDKIHRMESLVERLTTPESYLREENISLAEEIRLLQSKVDRHPEVTRFALENIRLLDQLRRFQDFYEEGERDILLAEVAELRNQVVRMLDEKYTSDERNNRISQNKLQTGLPESPAEIDALKRELTETQEELEDCRSRLKCCLQSNAKLTMEIGSLRTELDGLNTVRKADTEPDDMELCSEFSSLGNCANLKHAPVDRSEEIIHLQLELDIFKTILGEERGQRSRERKQLTEITEQYYNAQNELKEARSIIDALEGQELSLITELEELRRTHQSETKARQETKQRVSASLNRRTKGLLEKETEEVCRQAEAETAEVIVCLQEEIAALREEAEESERKAKALQDRVLLLSEDNERLNELVELKDEEWEGAAREIAEILYDGNTTIEDSMVDSFCVERIRKAISDKEGQIQDLQSRVVEAQRVQMEMEWKLKSLRGAMLAITEAQQQENREREREISEKDLSICVLQDIVNKFAVLAIVSFAAAGKLSEMGSAYRQELEEKELLVYYFEIMHLQKDSMLAELGLEFGALQSRLAGYEESGRSESESKKALEDITAQLTLFRKNIGSEEQEVDSTLEKLGEKVKSLAVMANKSLTAWKDIKQEFDAELSEAKMTAIQRDIEALIVLCKLEETTNSLSCLAAKERYSEKLTEKIHSLEDLCTRYSEDLFHKDLELCVLESELKEKTEESKLKSARAVSLERERSGVLRMFAAMKEEVILLAVEGKMREELMRELEGDNSILEREVETARFEETKIKSAHADALERERSNLLRKFAAMKEEVVLLAVEGEMREELTRELEVDFNILEREVETARFEESKLKSAHADALERERSNLLRKFDAMKEDVVLLAVEGKMREELMQELEADCIILEREVNTARNEVSNVKSARAMAQERDRNSLLRKFATMKEELIFSAVEGKMRELMQELEADNSTLEREVDTARNEVSKIKSAHEDALERERNSILRKFAIMKEEVILSAVEGKMREELVHELQAENIILEREVETARTEESKIKSARAVAQERERSSLLRKFGAMKEEIILSMVEEKMREELMQELEADICILERKMETARIEDSKIKSARAVAQERERSSLLRKFAAVKEEVILSAVEGKMREELIQELEADNIILEREVETLHRKLETASDDANNILGLLRERNAVIEEMQTQVNVYRRDLETELEDQIKILHSKNDEIRVLTEKLTEMTSELDLLQREKARLIEVSELKDKDLSSVSRHISILEEQNLELQSEIHHLHQSISHLEGELERKSSEIADVSSSRSRFCADVSALTIRLAALEEQNDKLKNEAANPEREDLINSLKEELAAKSDELDRAVSQSQPLAGQIAGKSELLNELEIEVMDARNLLNQKDRLLERLADERGRLDAAIVDLEEKLEMARALAEEHEAIAMEAKQIAESKRVYAEEKEEEVRLLERSVEELECTVNMLENKVEMVKEEAEKQRLEREDLEMELEVVRNKIMGLESSNGSRMMAERESAISQRILDEKLRELFEARKQIESLQKDLEDKESEIIQCRAHIAELNLHAEAQARENSQRIKELECMAQQVKVDASSSHGPVKQEKTAVKTRGSGSPFKCIGLGLTQLINSERDEELTTARSRIEELESMAARRQKEIFMLNARLAKAESMTHDVIRDLLGVKLDMSSYASLLDDHRSDKLAGNTTDPQEKEQMIINLKERLDEFLSERDRWVNEINKKHSEMMAAKAALEGIREREQLLSADNEILKAANAKQKKAVAQLEDEVKRLQREQNLQHRIHHHAKIKQENVALRAENEELTSRLTRMKEDLVRRR
ncbi:phragmoplast orienting kinesin 2 [Wolffia australiana]